MKPMHEATFETPVFFRVLYALGAFLFLALAGFLIWFFAHREDLTWWTYPFLSIFPLFMVYLAVGGFRLLWFSRFTLKLTKEGVEILDSKGAMKKVPWAEVKFISDNVLQVYSLFDGSGCRVYMTDYLLSHGSLLRKLVLEGLPAHRENTWEDTNHVLAQQLASQPIPRKVGLETFGEDKGNWVFLIILGLLLAAGAVAAFYNWCPPIMKLFGKVPEKRLTLTDLAFPYIVLGFFFWYLVWLYGSLRKDWVLFKYGEMIQGKVAEVIDTPGGRGTSGTQSAIVRFTYHGQEEKVESDWVHKPERGDMALVLIDSRNPKNRQAYFQGDKSMVKVLKG
jgi:hypothetical protein